ncbi:MAG: LytTR family DNA-binding domain-containing protein [Bacteroidota bacterium]
MNIRALIIDDEPLAHLVILEYAKSVPNLEIVGQCHLATEALAFLQETAVDLVFLDINMPKLKGLDFLRTLKNPPLAIITSAYEEYALESFDLDVCDYLLKPFRLGRFLKAVHKAQEVYQFKTQSKAPFKSNQDKAKHTFIKSDKRMVQVNFDDIHYLESYGNYVKVWLEKEYLLTPSTLTNFIEQLPQNQFYKIHKSYVVNLKKVDYLEGNAVVMKNNTTLSIGKNQRQAFKVFIANYKN